jgi:tripartite-type tricarboxylate transporter receptor subunit TctC
VARWHETVRHALADPAVRTRLEALGAIPLGTEPAAFAEYLRQQREAMAQLVREMRIELG